MAKNTQKKSKKPIPLKANIQELNESRDGGQIALSGYSYQFLYSCYLILSSLDCNTSFQLEGIEDIDCITQNAGNDNTTHIQLKYSKNKQDASFLSDVLKNFLEAYLLDQNRSFKLVYDFPVAQGNLQKLFDGKLDCNSYTYWKSVISKIQKEQNLWNWSAYDYDQFLSRLSFERIEKPSLAMKIEDVLIKAYGITTDNLSLYANSIKILCFEKMEQKAFVSKKELDACIENVKNDISKGFQNPAHSWIRKLDYSVQVSSDGCGFYEGKKATPADIASGLPIRRPVLEREIIESISDNTITVIEASSGQGKTTLALQAAYSLQTDYVPYQLLFCDDTRELGNIVQYFKSRIRLGEKVLILIDNLDNQTKEWNRLAQLLQVELPCHYKLLVTSREIDWYNFSGDLSGVQSLNTIKPTLDKNEAAAIYKMFYDAGKIHSGIGDWQKAWNRIAERQLLIEYVYLLTHGEMISERIRTQLSEIGQSPFGAAKCDLLRKVCFADICGIKLPISEFYTGQLDGADIGELLKNMAAEFLIHLNEDDGYIEGLHPIRSQHIVDSLHEFLPIGHTAISVIKMAQKKDLPTLFSHFPEFDLDKNKFSNKIVEVLWDNHDLSGYLSAIRGLFSGSVMQYYRANQQEFDTANDHGGLFILSTEKCPFTTFEEFGVSIDTLDRLREVTPDNKNVEFLCALRDQIPQCDLHETFIYSFCACLYKKLSQVDFSEINDIASYAEISEWIYNIDPTFNLSRNFQLESIWQQPERFSLNTISTLMFVSFCGNKDTYLKFVDENVRRILLYLRHQTNSIRLYIDGERNALCVEYLLRLQDIKTANDASVSRLKYICKTLPMFELYCADALKPSLDILSAYPIPDDAHKEMPARNLIIMFRQNLTSLWDKTIMSNYEFDTISEWLEHWFNVRNHICLLAEKFCSCIYKLLEGKSLGNMAGEVDQLREQYSQLITGEKRYPHEDRPFEEKPAIPEGWSHIKNKYFQSMQNVSNQFAGFLSKDSQKQRLAMVNLITVQSSLLAMQQYFSDIADSSGFREKYKELCNRETRSIEHLMMCCSYYQTHSASKYFSKYHVKYWYEEHLRNERESAEESLSLLQNCYAAHFPKQIYTIGMLRYYPIIVDNLDATSESAMSELLIECAPFAKTSFDYLVVLLRHKSGEINLNALQFPKRMLEKIYNAIETEDGTQLKDLTPPYPIEVTTQMLDCFTEKYNIPAKPKDEDNSIGDIGQDLWAYSKVNALLADPEEGEYLLEELQKIQSRIAERVRNMEDILPVDDLERLKGICREVFENGQFDDMAFNKFLEQFS